MTTAPNINATVEAAGFIAGCLMCRSEIWSFR
jgi:hypothetical protein